MTRIAEDYLNLPYHFVFVHDRSEDGQEGYVAEVEELPGCVSQGQTIPEAAEHLRDAMLGWIDVMLQDGKSVPEPRPEPSYSGKFIVRLAPSLHEALSREAEIEGVSLNQFVTSALAGAVGWRRTPTQEPLGVAEQRPTWDHLEESSGSRSISTENLPIKSAQAIDASGMYADVSAEAVYDMPLQRLAEVLAERVAREITPSPQTVKKG